MSSIDGESPSLNHRQHPEASAIHPEVNERGYESVFNQRSFVREDAAADARYSSRDALNAGIALSTDIVNDTEADPIEIDRATIRLREYGDELAKRQSCDRATNGRATQQDREVVAWDRLRDAVLESVDTPEVLQLAGIPMRRTGHSRGREEWHGPCPICGGGEDRLIAWSGPRGRLWCRRCGWSGDAIGAASLIVGTGQYRDALRWLANLVNVAEGGGR